MNEININIPRLNPFPSNVTLKRWLQASGNYITSGTEICILLVGPIECSIYAPHSGTLVHLCSEGSSLTPHQRIGQIQPRFNLVPDVDLSSSPIARNVFEIESKAIANLASKLDTSFDEAIHFLSLCRGRIILCGIGKSGLVAKKIAATLASTGSPSFFLHPAEALHGDLGILMPEDCFVSISYSGETDEILQLIPHLKRLKIPHISLTGHPNSTLAKLAQFVLDIGITQEASSLSVVPMASSITSMAMGDAIAASLIKIKQFNENDFALNHPGGNLGRKLVITVEQVMQQNNLPYIQANVPIKEVLVQMSSGMFGMVIIGDSNQVIEGIITDGDLRRALNKYQEQHFFELRAIDIMTKQPKTIPKDCLLYKAEQLMLDFKITALPVVENGKICGLIAKHQIK